MKADYVSPQLWKWLYSNMCYENALAVRVSLETGLRIGDVVSLPREAIKGGELHYYAKKTKKEGVCRISNDLARRLQTIRSDVFIFSGAKEGKHRTRQAVYKDVKKVAKKYGIKENVTPHSARKTYGAEKYHSEGLKAVQRDLQHDSEVTSLIYALSDKITETQVPLRNLNTEENVQAIAEKVVALLAEKLGLEKKSV